MATQCHTIESVPAFSCSNFHITDNLIASTFTYSMYNDSTFHNSCETLISVYLISSPRVTACFIFTLSSQNKTVQQIEKNNVYKHPMLMTNWISKCQDCNVNLSILIRGNLNWKNNFDESDWFGDHPVINFAKPWYQSDSTILGLPLFYVILKVRENLQILRWCDPP